MARVRIKDVIKSLSPKITRALEAAVKEEIPDAEFDSGNLFRAFDRQLHRNTNTWERVSDSFVEFG
jgi:hypothetical protein